MVLWEPTQLDQMIARLAGEGYTVIGPAVRDDAVVYDEIDTLPVGIGDEQEAGHYRLRDRGDDTRFGYNLGPSTWKQFLFPAREEIFRYANGEIEDLESEKPAMAFIGVRACELAAIGIQDTVFCGGGFKERHYAARRDRCFIVAVDCSQAAATCFCRSSNDGPAVGDGADVVITEFFLENSVRYLVRGATDRGVALVESIGGTAATEASIAAAKAAVDEARSQMQRELPRDGLRDTLFAALEHPHWQTVAERCLSCGNCTQVCPTCFCSAHTEETNPVSLEATRVRHWDSCFTQGHSYVHGGPMHGSIASRYRQWLTHKLASWEDQFGRSGCTGCGRCVTWCPVGIDITEEVRILGDET